MEGFSRWLGQLQTDKIWIFLITAVSCLVCITVHECCHALAAWALGDPTARRAGRLSLNPVRHIDLMGLIMLAVVHFGWAKPVPVDMRNFRNPKAGMALTALAGPAGNVVLTAAAMALHGVCYFYSVYYESALWGWLDELCIYTAILSTGLCVFNLFPVPPLDGSKVLAALLPPRFYLWLMQYERWGMFLLMGLLLLGVLDAPLNFLREGLMNLMSPLSRLPFEALVSIYF